MKNFLQHRKNKKGITLVWGAFFLVLLLMFAGMAIDIAYMYVVKNQLQVAADASVLASAANLSRTLDNSQAAYEQLSARRQAWKFACKNTAADNPKNVYLVSDFSGLSCNNADSLSASSLNGTNNNPDGDIIVGNWSDTLRDCPSTDLPTEEEKFCPANGSTGLEINAAKVIARRTGENPVPNVKNGNNSVSVFLGKIFRYLGGQGWTLMSARASAIAKCGLQTLPIVICTPRCNPIPEEFTNFNDPDCPGKKFLSNPPDDELQCGIAGTNVTACPPTCSAVSASELKNFFENPYPIDICDKCVRTNQGSIMSSVLQEIENAFNTYKTVETIQHVNASNPSENWTATITGWHVLIPVLEITSGCGSVGPKPCPGDQPNPYLVGRMAEVIITKVDSPPHDDCPNCSGHSRAGVTMIGTVTTANSKITRIGCLTCDEANQLSGSKTRLVR